MSCLRLPYRVQLVTLFRLRATLQLRVFTALVNRPIWSVLCASTIIVPLKLEFLDQAHHKLYRPISKASVGRRNRTPVKWASGDCLDHIDFIVCTSAVLYSCTTCTCSASPGYSCTAVHVLHVHVLLLYKLSVRVRQFPVCQVRGSRPWRPDRVFPL